MNESDILLADHLHRIDRAKLSKILTDLFFSYVFRQITKIDVA